jgi:hypothetical protein
MVPVFSIFTIDDLGRPNHVEVARYRYKYAFLEVNLKFSVVEPHCDDAAPVAGRKNDVAPALVLGPTLILCRMKWKIQNGAPFPFRSRLPDQ